MQIPRHVGQARFFSFVPHQMKMLFAELAVFLALDGLVLRDPLTYIYSVNENAHDSVSERLERWTRNPLGSARKGSNPLAVDVTSTPFRVRKQWCHLRAEYKAVASAASKVQKLQQRSHLLDRRDYETCGWRQILGSCGKNGVGDMAPSMRPPVGPPGATWHLPCVPQWGPQGRHGTFHAWLVLRLAGWMVGCLGRWLAS